MQLVISPQGIGQCLYDETLDLTALGSLTMVRASHVERGERGQWWADLSPLDGPRLGPFVRRSVALAAERVWLETNWLWRSGR